MHICAYSSLLYKDLLQDHDNCKPVLPTSETLDHQLAQCSYSREVWLRLLRPLGLQALVPTSGTFAFVWWLTSPKRLPADFRKLFDSFVFLVIWLLWKERNARFFDKREGMLWVLLESCAHRLVLLYFVWHVG